MNVHQIKTIFLILAAIARGTHACLSNVVLGRSCATVGACCNFGDCDVRGSFECRYTIGKYCDADSLNNECAEGKFGSIFHMICNS